MSAKLGTEPFRSAFKKIDIDLVRWFPGHMGRGLKQVQHKLRTVDCVIEVHDARIPISGRNTDFKHTVSGIKPHILVLNKMDMINKSFQTRIRERLGNEYKNIVYTNCKTQNCKGVASLFPLAKDLISNSDRYNRSCEDDFNVMIIGVPNVGKSSLINALRIKYLNKGKATKEGAAPGITKSVLHRIKMCEKPLFYLLDTPGILTPNVGSAEAGLKLALCATIQDHLVGEKIIADYLLYWLNKNSHFDYVKFFSMEAPSDNILEVLTHISIINKKTIKLRDHSNNYILRPNLDQAARLMLNAFRNGDLGKIVLDEDLL